MGGVARARGVALTLIAVVVLLLASAPASQASFHLIKVREVYPDASQNSYVELQMYAGAQSLLAGHSMTLYNAAGTLVHSSTFSAGVGNAQNQATVLIGDSGVQSAFGVAPDLVDSGLSIPAAGGAACWNAGGLPADCVAWGNFNGGAALQMATGTTVGSPVSPGGVTDGKAIRRTIEPGCPTLLEDSDDANASATDFAEVTPTPRNNGSAISEKTCAGAPNTVIDDRPPAVTNETNAAFTYESPTATGYECKLDSAAFAPCEADGIEYKDLADSTHGFQVRGVNGSGPDPTPATYSWRVDTAPPTAAIDQKPADPSSGVSATFAFHADETGSKFACSLVLDGQPSSFSDCTSSKTYTSLADGDWTFELRATDAAGNQQPIPTSYSWTVDNSLADTTPPQTTITGHPADPSSSSDAAFSYASNEPGSNFECALDGGGFLPCAASGISYSGLAQGSHSFQVRAIDTSANVDPSPAGFSFQVVLPAVQLAPPPPPPAPAVEPQTFISGKPAAKSTDRTPTFRFHSDQIGATYQCALDRDPFRSCRSPFTSKPLKPGPHRFSVRAIVGATRDASSATFRFKVVERRK